MRFWLIGLAIAFGLVTGATAAPMTRFVDPLIGTDGTGHVFPGALIPFGMVAVGPDNADRGWSYASGYQYRAPRILGFSNTHISGAGIPELGDVLLQPKAGDGWSRATSDFSSSYIKASERAAPGFYAVRLTEGNVRVELTATQRVAIQRYHFGDAKRAQVLVDLQHGLHFVEGPRVLSAQSTLRPNERLVTGTVFSRNWVERQASFVVQFDRPWEAVEEVTPRPGDRAKRYVFSFALDAQKSIEARIALSTIDEAGALNNLREGEGRTFETVRNEADAAWETLLSRVKITAPERQKRIFYSALYRVLMHPSDIADRDGRVRGPRGAIIQARGGRYYSTLSLWDTFRGVHPLLTMIAPERVDGFILSFLDHHRQQGYLPLWTAWGRETWTMIGNPALPVIADAMAKGFTGFDSQEAMQAMVETSTLARIDGPAWGLRDWDAYERFGYVPFDAAPGEAVSKTLEYGIGDDAVARVANLRADAATTARFARRAQGYRLLYDAGTQTFRGRDSKGAWRTPFDPLAPTSPMNNPGDYTEANAYQYTLTPALHDPEGLRDLIGGPDALEAWLDRFFSLQGAGDNKFLGQEAMIGQYAHGNEPSHHIAYLYNWTNAPEKGRAMIRRIAHAFYADAPNGIIGNDDCGQMSAWYVLSSLGMYPVQPASGAFAAGYPLVRSAEIALPGEKRLRIARNGREGEAPRLNGRPLDPRAIAYKDLMQGGVISFAASP